jgi:hypothetical protein
MANEACSRRYVCLGGHCHAVRMRLAKFAGVELCNEASSREFGDIGGDTRSGAVASTPGASSTRRCSSGR